MPLSRAEFLFLCLSSRFKNRAIYLLLFCIHSPETYTRNAPILLLKSAGRTTSFCRLKQRRREQGKNEIRQRGMSAKNSPRNRENGTEIVWFLLQMHIFSNSSKALFLPNQINLFRKNFFWFLRPVIGGHSGQSSKTNARKNLRGEKSNLSFSLLSILPIPRYARGFGHLSLLQT